MITDEQIRLFSQYCSENFGTELKSVRKSERYQSLPICVLDCVYSLRTKYFAVTVPVLQTSLDKGTQRKRCLHTKTPPMSY